MLYGHVLELMDWLGFEQDVCADMKSSVASPSGLIAQALHLASMPKLDCLLHCSQNVVSLSFV